MIKIIKKTREREKFRGSSCDVYTYILAVDAAPYHANEVCADKNYESIIDAVRCKQSKEMTVKDDCGGL